MTNRLETLQTMLEECQNAGLTARNCAVAAGCAAVIDLEIPYRPGIHRQSDNNVASSVLGVVNNSDFFDDHQPVDIEIGHESRYTRYTRAMATLLCNSCTGVVIVSHRFSRSDEIFTQNDSNANRLIMATLAIETPPACPGLLRR